MLATYEDMKRVRSTLCLIGLDGVKRFYPSIRPCWVIRRCASSRDILPWNHDWLMWRPGEQKETGLYQRHVSLLCREMKVADTRPHLCLTLSFVPWRDSRGCSDGDSSSSAGDMNRSSTSLLESLRALLCRDHVWAHPPREALLHGHRQRLRRVLNHAALLAWKVHGHQRVLRDAPLKLRTNISKISLCSQRTGEDFPFQD